MSALDDDATLTQVATAWVGLFLVRFTFTLLAPTFHFGREQASRDVIRALLGWFKFPIHLGLWGETREASAEEDGMALLLSTALCMSFSYHVQ